MSGAENGEPRATPDGDDGSAEVTFEPGMYDDTWLVKYRGRPHGAVGFALGDGRWRAAWQGTLVGDSYDTRAEAAAALIERRRRAEAGEAP